ncbi:Superfamily II DNA helicase RecQ [Proteiniphilum saccharofermentans]|uniref:ATP-dependent DNA helicase RecQ n=1 Tax=Proteiniphilum saccharofermentans TaxID=1642647 RepID=A0A1R3TEK6_9BACT|nr:ATP-dependent DNA helicase RecQ [Proteiniphilum saccharofermentans]SCD22054.1 Superfamily II DNA helicase RecQ [Proteiniphilum saccharofermentans]
MQSDLFHNILRENWGYSSFRPLQEEIIQSIWEGRDTLGLMPTGGGKSLTFQVPVLGMKGICLVVTPLIALMKDQVDNLRERGIKAAAVYSGMSREEIITTLENCIFGDYKFLYVSPERLSSEIFIAKLQAMNVCLLVVDESHCISQWGYDFRPSYLKIAEIRKLLEGVPLLALTATATREVVDDIQEKLLFKEKNVFRVSFERENLSYVVRTVENKTGELLHVLQSVPGSAIVYVRSRQKTAEVAQSLRKAGISADFFHAGLSYEDKVFRQNAWKMNDCRVIVATNAFGMGIDKPDVRTVVHLDLPNSLEEYFQEAGRAGRDGERSYAIILYTKADSAKLKKRITDSFPARDFVLRVYEALGNYYQIAVGAGYNDVYDFSLQEFCQPYKLPFLQTHHALKILELAGYIEYTEEIDMRSRIRFLIYRDDIYSLHLEKEMDGLLHAVLRNYTGVFSDDVYIDESLLAVKTGKSRREICEMLIALSRAKYIRYIPQKKTPFIVFTTSREDAQFVSIPRTVYEERKKRFEKRIFSMIHYAEEADVCRGRMLLIYFGELSAEDCGHCDVCLKKSATGLPNYLFHQIANKLRDTLLQQVSLRFNELIDAVLDKNENSEENRERVIPVLRFLIDTGEFTLTDDVVTSVKKVEN